MTGRAWRFGDNIDTDLLAPGAYLKLSFQDAAIHCLEAIAPDFSRQVKAGDIVVAGKNFGLGSSREGAAQSLKILGVRAVLAESFGRIFYRNALNIGLPALFFADWACINDGDTLDVDVAAGAVADLTTGARYPVEPIPAHLLQMMQDGGLIPHLKNQFAETSR